MNNFWNEKNLMVFFIGMYFGMGLLFGIFSLFNITLMTTFVLPLEFILVTWIIMMILAGSAIRGCIGRRDWWSLVGIIPVLFLLVFGGSIVLPSILASLHIITTLLTTYTSAIITVLGTALFALFPPQKSSSDKTESA